MLLQNPRALAVLTHVSTALAATYKQHQEVIGEDFIEDAFTFETMDDPTRGRVNYVNKETAKRFNLTYATRDSFFLRADSDSVVKPKERGRASPYSEFCLIKDLVHRFDIRHMPTGCGSWPAVWEVGDNWPSEGEIDILEGVNDIGPNAVTLHTGDNCFMARGRFDKNPNGQKGVQVNENSDVKADKNTGCSVKLEQAPSSYGKEFNKARGGFYALERGSKGIKVWFWPRNADNIPEAVEKGAKSVDPNTWGQPDAWFPGGEHCNIDAKFGPQNIIINLTFCGDWAGGDAFGKAGCHGNCRDYVDKNPQEFKEAYFEIGSLRTYIP